MEKEHFKAHVQYDDWKGSVAADSADQDEVVNKNWPPR